MGTRPVLKAHLILLEQTSDPPCATGNILHLVCLQGGLQDKNKGLKRPVWERGCMPGAPGTNASAGRPARFQEIQKPKQ